MIAVVKLGGSLSRDTALKDWLSMLAKPRASKVVIVPGGGPFADGVREAQARWSFDDQSAHKMALLAMEQYAHLLSALEPRLALADNPIALTSARVSVWLPSKMALAAPEIPATWDVTSDSLAAWLAIKLGARRLILVKSLASSALSKSISDLVGSGVVDRGFPRFAKVYEGDIVVISKTEVARMQDYLDSKNTP
jgi:5-(aminomethyl)-3-furanmethanol phosphate kinase